MRICAPSTARNAKPFSDRPQLRINDEVRAFGLGITHQHQHALDDDAAYIKDAVRRLGRMAGVESVDRGLRKSKSGRGILDVVSRYCERRERCAIADIKLLKDMMQMNLDRAVGKTQSAPDFLVRESL